MRPSLTALLAVPAAITLAVSVARATPTPEEVALREALEGRPAAAVAVLERAQKEDPLLRWVAGRVALRAGDAATARRLLAGDDANALWGVVDLDLAAGRAGEAAVRALAELDRALSGVHREALGRLLVEQAKERSGKDAPNAARMLDAVLALDGIAPSLRIEAEDALFRLPGPPDAGTEAAARRRLTGSAGDLLARRVVGEATARRDPALTAAILAPVLDAAPRDEALRAAGVMAALPVPPPIRLDALSRLSERFPDDEEVLRLRLSTTAAAGSRDEALADRLAPLFDHPRLGGEAMEAWARAATDPAERRDRALRLAAREGASARGEAARRLAREALLESVAATPEGEARREAARRALDEPDAKGDPSLLHAALEPGEGYVDAAFALAERFPGDGVWCAPLADRLVARGARAADAERYASVCARASSREARALLDLHAETPSLVLVPVPGGIDVLAPGATSLEVAQHRVDPAALLGTAEGHPLDTRLDAFLVDPDTTFTIEPVEGRLARIPVRPRGKDPLVSLSVRAGDLRATALVVVNPLRVEAVRQGGAVALAVFDGDVPAEGALLHLRDGQGKVRTSTISAGGVAVVRGVVGTATLMAARGSALGYAVSDEAGRFDADPEWLDAIVLDRAVSVEGAPSRVQVLGGRRGLPAEGKVRLKSYTPTGTLLEEVDAVLSRGAAGVLIWLQGGGSLEVLRGEAVRARVPVAAAADGPGPAVAIEAVPSEPRPGEPLQFVLHATAPPPPGGRHARVRLVLPWGSEEAEHVLTDAPIAVPVELRAATPGDVVRIEAEIGGIGVVGTSVRVEGPPRPDAPRVSPLVLVGQPLEATPPPDCWLKATHDEGTEDLWRPPGGAPLVLPRSGRWHVSSWCTSEGPATPVEALATEDDADDARRWNRARPGLAALTAESVVSAKVVRKGDALTAPPPAGSGVAWSVVVGGPVVPVPAEPAVRLALGGDLARAGEGLLEVGPGLPAGTRVWAFVRDASDGIPAAVRRALPERWTGEPGTAASPFSASDVPGETIAAGLLAEEQRAREQAPARRIDLGKIASQAEMAEPSAAGEGWGSGVGGGDLGSTGHGRGGGGAARQAGNAARTPGFDPASLAFLDGVAPGRHGVRLPGWVTRAWIEAVALTPDGRWLQGTASLPVRGAAPTSRPKATTVPLPESWDGTLAGLRAVARTLPIDARRQALAGLVDRGDRASAPLLAAALAHRAVPGPGAAVARKLGHGKGPEAAAALRRLEGLPDPRRAERVLAALEAAPGDPDRAVAAVRRLVRDGELQPWVRSRAALALWAAGEQKEAEALLVGDDPSLAAARVVVTGRADPSRAAAFWAVARELGAPSQDRALAVLALARGPGQTVLGLLSPAAAHVLQVQVQPPLASVWGTTFPRGASVASGNAVSWSVGTADRAPAGRTVPVRVEVPPSPVPTRLHCPEVPEFVVDDPWRDLAPAASPRTVECLGRLVGEGGLSLSVTWHGPDGAVIGRGEARLAVDPARPSDPADPMSPDERHGLGCALAARGAPGGREILHALLGEDWLSGVAVAHASEALLEDARRRGEPKALVAAFEAHRERNPSAALDLGTAAAVAHAYAAAGEPARAVQAARVVLDARFREELGAVRSIHEGGLALTALKLLREVLARYPDGPTSIQARYLAPSMLLERAGGEGDRLGFTRSSLRHTAAGELARFLLLHPDAATAPDAASLLLDSVRQLRDAERQQALAGPLARRYRASPQAWRLALADARARFARGRFEEARAVLAATKAEGEGESWLALEAGRVAEALGRRDDALDRYRAASGVGDARARLDWLERADLVVPSLVAVPTGAPEVLPSELLPGTPVDVIAYRIALESLLLRDGGTLDPLAVRVDGLRPAARTAVKATALGDLPLPSLPPGAYLLTVTAAGGTHRAVWVKGDLDLSVRGGPDGGSLVHLLDARGRPLRDARIWVFEPGGEARAERTDALGAVHLPVGGGAWPTLARVGDRYALSTGMAPRPGAQRPGRRPAEPARFDDAGLEGLIEQNKAAYDEIFRQDRKAKVEAKGL